MLQRNERVTNQFQEWKPFRRRGVKKPKHGTSYKLPLGNSSSKLRTINLAFHETHSEVNFLIDSGSDVSIIKKPLIEDFSKAYKIKDFILEGIGEGHFILSQAMTLNHELFSHTFLIVPENFKIYQDGILGGDFFERLGADIEIIGKVHKRKDSEKSTTSYPWMTQTQI